MFFSGTREHEELSNEHNKKGGGGGEVGEEVGGGETIIGNKREGETKITIGEPLTKRAQRETKRSGKV